VFSVGRSGDGESWLDGAAMAARATSGTLTATSCSSLAGSLLNPPKADWSLTFCGGLFLSSKTFYLIHKKCII